MGDYSGTQALRARREPFDQKAWEECERQRAIERAHTIARKRTDETEKGK